MKAEILTDAQFNQVIQALKGRAHEKRNIALMYVSFNLGLRAKEMAGLRVGDVWENGALVEETTLYVTKGNKKRRTYLANQRLRQVLQDYLDTLSAHELRTDKPLFRSQKGGAFTPNTMQQMFHKFYAWAGINASSHVGRCTFITNLLHEKKVPVKYAQVAAGHSSASMTLHYAKVDTNELKKIYGKGVY